MATIAELQTKLDKCEISADALQARVIARNQTIADLNAQLANAVTAADLDAIASRLDSLDAKLAAQ